MRLDADGRTLDAPPLGTAAAISIGTNPTFDGTSRRVEAYLLDFEGDLYGAHLGVEFVEHLRGQVRFEGVPALIEQMGADVARTREIVAG